MNGLLALLPNGHLLPANFHFLRPEWLLALLPALALAGLVWKRMGSGQSAWAGLVDAHLLRHLALTDRSRAGRWPVFALLAAYALAILAMAGPAWQKLPTPTLDRIDPTVVVLSLAQSMNATDQPPTRLAAARHKVDDILSRMRGGQVALVIFADAPFVASPLTEDARVVQQMLPEIGTDLMPVMDNRPDIAIRQAIDLLRNTGAPTGRIILVGDGLGDRPEQTKATAAAAGNAGYHLSVIGVGRDAPTPLVTYDGRPLTGRDRTPLTTRMDEAGLKDVALAGRGIFTPLSVGDRDIDAILAQGGKGPAKPGELQDSGLAADQWVDMGPFVLLAVVALFAPLAFRRGWIALLLLGVLAGAAPLAPAQAQDQSLSQRWRDLWQTPDQQAAAAFQSQDYQGAASRFANPEWQASSLYKAGDYEKAADAYSRLPNGAYNQANALARAGKLEDAVKAYDEALKQNPDNADAIYNRSLVQKLIDDKKKMDLPQPPPPNQQNKDNKGGGGGGSNQQDQQQQDKGDNKQNNAQNQKDQNKDKKDQGQQDQKDKKPDGDDEGKQKPDPKPGQQPQQSQPKPDPGQKNQPQQGQDQPKPQPKDQGNDPAKADPKDGKDANKPDSKDGKDAPKPDQKDGKDAPKPDPRTPGNTPAQPQPAQPNPQGQLGQQPQPAQPAAPQPAQPAQQGGDQQGSEQQGLALAPLGLRPMTPEDQNREQAIRMVPDDPMGLLRARIRAHYTGRPPEVEGVNQP